jgi:predicted RNase H-like HicB family nuclease
MRFKIILEEDEEVGGFIASCPGLPGCFSQGDTVEEAIENIKEAIQVCLESLVEDELQECIGKSSCIVVDVVA